MSRNINVSLWAEVGLCNSFNFAKTAYVIIIVLSCMAILILIFQGQQNEQ